LFGGLTEGGELAVQHSLKGFAQIFQQMPAIGYLDRLRRSRRGGFGVITGSVAADDLNARVMRNKVSALAAIFRCWQIREPASAPVSTTTSFSVSRKRQLRCA
jgi:hypothetical protein